MLSPGRASLVAHHESSEPRSYRANRASPMPTVSLEYGTHGQSSRLHPVLGFSCTPAARRDLDHGSRSPQALRYPLPQATTSTTFFPYPSESLFTPVLRMLSRQVSRRIPTGTKTSIRSLRAFAGRRKRATRVEIVNQELCGESTLLSYRSMADEGDKILRWTDFDPPFLLQTLATSLTLTPEEVFGLKKSTTYYNLDAMSLLNPTSATIRATLLPFCRERIRYIDTLPFSKKPSTLAINYCPIIRPPSIHFNLIRPCY